MFTRPERWLFVLLMFVGYAVALASIAALYGRPFTPAVIIGMAAIIIGGIAYPVVLGYLFMMRIGDVEPCTRHPDCDVVMDGNDIVRHRRGVWPR